MANKNLNFKMPRQKRVKISDSGKTKKLKWWHILLIVLGVIIIALGIAAAIIFGRLKDTIENVQGAVGGDAPVIIGGKKSTGIYVSNEAEEYILCEYTELLSGENKVFLQKKDEVRFDYKAYYVFIAADGKPDYHFSGEYTGEYTPEQIKADMFSLLKSYLGYTDEKLASCDVAIYDPVSFAKVKVSSVETFEDGKATVNCSVGAVEGLYSEEYALSATYTMTENEFTFTFEELPENELLRSVAEKLLTKASYKSFVMHGSWQNTLTFGDVWTLYMKTE